jgi:hypothetical protein
MKVAIRATSKQLIPTGPFRICNLSCNCGDKISKPYRLVSISQAAEPSWRSQISNQNFRVRAKLLKSGTKLKTRSLHVKSLNAIKAERNHLGKTSSFFPIWLGIIVCNVDRRKWLRTNARVAKFGPNASGNRDSFGKDFETVQRMLVDQKTVTNAIDTKSPTKREVGAQSSPKFIDLNGRDGQI